MQLELGIGARAGAGADIAPRVLALHVPDLPLQRALRALEASSATPGRPRRPLAVEREGRVAACDAAARAEGVRAGDTLVQARAACAGLEVVPAVADEERAAMEGLAEALLALAPAVEIAGEGDLLLDASGARLVTRTGGDAEAALAERAVALAAEMGLRCRAAVASGRAPARALARHGSARAVVGPGATTAALAALPLAALELPADLTGRLGALGLREVGDLARLPPSTLAHRFGPAGLAAWRLAQGDDPSPLTPYVPRGLPEERLELDAPVESLEPLLFGLRRVCERLAARLAGRGLGATRLTLALRLDPQGLERVALALAAPSSAAAGWIVILRERLGELRLPAAVAAASLAVEEAAPAAPEQLTLGDRPERIAALEAVLTRLTARLGAEALFAAEPVDRHRPEAAYRAGAFAGRRRPGVRPARRRSKGRGPAEVAPAALDVDAEAGPPLDRPLRLLARPQPLLALGEGGRLTAVRLDGQTLRVLALSPAERLAGEWWSDPFDRDYHRARLEGVGDCWIFRDAGDGRLWLHGFFD